MGWTSHKRDGSTQTHAARVDGVRTSVARLLALLVALCGLAAVSVAPASAHDRLLGSDPADGAVLDHSPTQITLTFSDEIEALGSQVVVVDTLGNELASGTPTIDGTSATLPLGMLTNSGYTVTWRVVSSDGHPIDGTFGFTVDDPTVGPTPEPTPAPTVEPTPEITAFDEPTEPADDATTPAADSDATASAEDAADEDALPWTGIIVGGLLGLAAGVGLLLLSKRRKHQD